MPAGHTLLIFGNNSFISFSLTWGESSCMCLLTTFQLSKGSSVLLTPLPLHRTSPHPRAWIGEKQRRKECLSWFGVSRSTHNTVPLHVSPWVHCDGAQPTTGCGNILHSSTESWVMGGWFPNQVQHTKVGPSILNSKSTAQAPRKAGTGELYELTTGRWLLLEMRCLPAAESRICH